MRSVSSSSATVHSSWRRFAHDPISGSAASNASRDVQRDTPRSAPVLLISVAIEVHQAVRLRRGLDDAPHVGGEGLDVVGVGVMRGDRDEHAYWAIPALREARIRVARLAEPSVMSVFDARQPVARSGVRRVEDPASARLDPTRVDALLLADHARLEPVRGQPRAAAPPGTVPGGHLELDAVLRPRSRRSPARPRACRRCRTSREGCGGGARRPRRPSAVSSRGAVPPFGGFCGWRAGRSRLSVDAAARRSPRSRPRLTTRSTSIVIATRSQ